MALIFGAYFLTLAFAFNSLGLIFEGDLGVILIYLGAFSLLITHYFIRLRYPERFISHSDHPVSLEDRVEGSIFGFLTVLACAIATSASIATLIFPAKFGFFSQKIIPAVEDIVVMAFSRFGMFFLFVGVIPILLTKLLVKEENKSLLLALFILIGVLLAVGLVGVGKANPDLLTQFTQNQTLRDLILWILGIPAFFWLKYLLFGGIEWLKARH